MLEELIPRVQVHADLQAGAQLKGKSEGQVSKELCAVARSNNKAGEGGY